MSSSAWSWRTSVLWQYSQTAKIDAADLKTTGAPQEGQGAVTATVLRSTQFFEQFHFFGVELCLAQHTFFNQPMQFFQRCDDLVGRN